MPQRIVIIGAGQAGAQAALTLRQKGYEGELTLVGAEPHVPYERPPLSKAYLKGDIDADRLALRSPDVFADRSITLRLTCAATALDRTARQVILQGDEPLAYDGLMLATGADPLVPPIPGIDLAGVHYLRSRDDADALKAAFKTARRLGIIGGGYIGLEVAAAAVRAGLEVTVFEGIDRVMARSVAPSISAHSLAVHRREGVDVRLASTVSALSPGADGRRVGAVHLADGATVPVDAVLVGVGVRPATTLAETAALAVDDGILVDEAARTTDPAIVAAGDCTRHPNPFFGGHVRLESVQNAVDQAKVAAATLLGETVTYDAVPWFWSDQYDEALRIVGLARPGDEAVTRGDPTSGAFTLVWLRDGTVAAIEAVNRLKDFTQGRKLVAGRARVDPDAMANPDIPLKTLMQPSSV